MTESFIYDYGSSKQRITPPAETDEIMREIYEEFIKDNKARQYAHQVNLKTYCIYISNKKKVIQRINRKMMIFLLSAIIGPFHKNVMSPSTGSNHATPFPFR